MCLCACDLKIGGLRKGFFRRSRGYAQKIKKIICVYLRNLRE